MFLSTFVTAVLLGIGILSFSFVFWLKLREDYLDKSIFSFTLLIFSGAIVGWWLSSTFLKGFLFWPTVLLAISAGVYGVKKLNLKFFEIVDAIAPAWFWLATFTYLAVISLSWALENYIIFFKLAVCLISMLLYWYFLQNYRLFKWYPSGKVGFAGLVSLALFFLIRSVVDVLGELSSLNFPPEMVSLVSSRGLWDAAAGIVFAITCLYVVYLRSGRRTK